MVYRPETIRHEQTPLRMTPAALAEFVDSQTIRCSHFDAFRFFTPAALPLNQLKPTPEARPDFEQPGCLHANMDIYKWAYKFYPWIGSDLIADAFFLALELREVDMRASPYDLVELGYEPIKIETPEGRAEYIAAQNDFANKAEPLRARLIEQLGMLIGT